MQIAIEMYSNNNNNNSYSYYCHFPCIMMEMSVCPAPRRRLMLLNHDADDIKMH